MKPKKPRTKKAQTKPLYQGSRPIAFGGARRHVYVFGAGTKIVLPPPNPNPKPLTLAQLKAAAAIMERNRQ